MGPEFVEALNCQGIFRPSWMLHLKSLPYEKYSYQVLEGCVVPGLSACWYSLGGIYSFPLEALGASESGKRLQSRYSAATTSKAYGERVQKRSTTTAMEKG